MSLLKVPIGLYRYNIYLLLVNIGIAVCTLSKINEKCQLIVNCDVFAIGSVRPLSVLCLVNCRKVWTMMTSIIKTLISIH